MSKGKIELFTAEGEVKEYKLFSARLPEFLKAFPKEQGYRVQVEASDTLSYKPGLQKLYEAAISSGKSPDQVGLPALPAGDVVVFKAMLLDKEGNVLESASALRAIRQYKDWEKGETAARQRLIAALGFGGECFDADEMSDIEDQGLQAKQAAAPTKAKAPAPVQAKAKAAAPEAAPTPAPAADAEQAQAAPAVEATSEEAVAAPQADASAEAANAPVQESDDANASAPADADPASAASAAAPSNGADEPAEQIPERLIRQIEHQAKLKGKEVPIVKTVKEAKQALKKLMQA